MRQLCLLVMLAAMQDGPKVRPGGASAMVLLLTVPLSLLYVPCRTLGRLLWRTRLRGQVGRGLDMALTAASDEPPRLWRVK